MTIIYGPPIYLSHERPRAVQTPFSIATRSAHLGPNSVVDSRLRVETGCLFELVVFSLERRGVARGPGCDRQSAYNRGFELLPQ